MRRLPRGLEGTDVDFVRACELSDSELVPHVMSLLKFPSIDSEIDC